MADVHEPDVGLPALQHPRPGTDRRLDLLEIAELLDALAGHEPGSGGGEHVEKPRRRLLPHEPDGVGAGDAQAVPPPPELPSRVAPPRPSPPLTLLPPLLPHPP